MSGLSQQIQQALESEGAYLVGSIRQSISDNEQAATGGTQASLRHYIEGNTLVIWGQNNLFSLEKGVSPADVSRLKTGYFAWKLLQWSIDKPIIFANEKERRTFAWRLAKKIQSEGSVLYGKGRRDVYTDKLETSVKRLSEAISDVIVNYKILN